MISTTRDRSRLRALSVLLPLALAASGCEGGPEYDVIIRGGTIIDGTGQARFEGDVAVRGEYVVRVGDLSNIRADEEIDATGLFVTPGFINLHSHDRLDAAPTAVNLLSQGVTTIILNADGGGPLDLSAQLIDAAAAGLAINIGPTIGFNSAWTTVNGRQDTRPSAEQIEAIRGFVESGLEAGAWGVSAGLDYKPTYYAYRDEVVAALADMGSWRTIFTNHDRLTPESGFSSFEGMRETIDIGERTGLMPVLTHMKIQGREQGSAAAVLAMMTEARERGVYTAADVYPYLAGQTSLAALIIPAWAQAGGVDALRERFGDPTQRARIVEESNEAIAARFGGPTGVFLPATQRELTDLMVELGAESGGDAVVRILEDDSPSAILRFGSEDDLAAIMAYPTSSIGCDCDPAEGRVGHPRGYGTFPRALGRYVRELGVLTWEDAIRKMTALPAATVGMVDRGIVAPGMVADLVVFDPETIIDHATFMEPDLPSEGVHHVMLNGQWAFREGTPTGGRAGRPLLRSPNMPARPDGTASTRSVAFAGSFAGGEGETLELSLNLSQAPGQREASGDFEVAGVNGDAPLDITALGVLQTADGWASLTGTARVGSLGERSFLLVVDAYDPAAVGAGSTVVLHIEGMEPVRGRSPTQPTITR